MNDQNRRLFVFGLGIALLLAVVVAQFASTSPDGLEYVAQEEGFADSAEDHDLADTPLANYGENLTGSSWVSNAAAGVAGVMVTLGVGYGLFWLARKTNRDRPTSA